MKTNKYVEGLKAKSAAELAQELVAAKKELFNLRFQNATNQLDNTARIKEVRKNIARIQTVITMKGKEA
ncbi:MAG: 50S ribosomal protein L29 [Lachnospiraceae bacterium]|nr:50S ribosomal protein L29 [Lachnospiraceae bacterium]